MAQISKISSLKHGLWRRALREASRYYQIKIAYLEKSVKSNESALTKLCQKYHNSSNMISRLSTKITTLKKWKSNPILHDQVVVDPLDLSEEDFDYLKDTSIKLLNFDIYNPKGEE
ncbi:hypothetical protein J1N35_043948 [Gossypium stocksii]|uniref:Uncharacterized protein n=1 Tax=Gossypium stocksii TaxID=47602 RepID=A0A9D3ZFH4_9ROSI|nr:hypothetical protein J1N35_043948 [Gossypium stocksii]